MYRTGLQHHVSFHVVKANAEHTGIRYSKKIEMNNQRKMWVWYIWLRPQVRDVSSQFSIKNTLVTEKKKVSYASKKQNSASVDLEMQVQAWTGIYNR